MDGLSKATHSTHERNELSSLTTGSNGWDANNQSEKEHWIRVVAAGKEWPDGHNKQPVMPLTH
jgi:hypothetical protein